MPKVFLPFPFLHVALATVLLGGVLACVPRIENRGNDIDLDKLVEIVPGKTEKSKVEKILGSPSIKSDFGEDTWMYVSGRTKTLAFFKEEMLDRKIIYISFIQTGVVDAIGTLSEKDGRKVELVNRQTPTAGQRITLIQQLLGNIGRFNQKMGQ